jgi:hypothetical protein
VDRLTATWPLIRDIAIVTTALVLIIFEAVFRDGPERPTLLLLYTGMLGLPAFLRADQRRSNGQPSEPAPEPER